MAKELRRLGWEKADLKQRHKSDAGKLAMAARRRRETTLPIKWIATRLQMETWKSMNKKLHCWTGAHETNSYHTSLNYGLTPAMLLAKGSN